MSEAHNRSPEPGEKGSAPRRHRKRKAGLKALRGAIVLAAFAVLAAVMVVGQRLHAPDWLKTRVEARLEQATGGLRVTFGDVSFVIHEGWRPRLRLLDLRLTDPAGRVIADLERAEASLAMRPLLKGEVRPKRIALSGARVDLRRERDGTLVLSSFNAARSEQAPDLPALMERWDALFLSPQFSALAGFELTDVSLQYRDLRAGRSWTADAGQVRITREGQEMRVATAFSVLGGRDYASSVEANYTSRLGEPEARFGISIADLAAEDIASQSPALQWLGVLQAPISGSLRGSVEAEGQLGTVSATLQIGPGAVQPNEGTKPIPFTGARTYFTYSPDLQRLDFNEIAIESAWGSAVADGQAFLDGVAEGRLDRLVGQLSLGNIRVNPDDVYPEPLEIDHAALDLSLRLDPFRLELGQMNVRHEDRTLILSGGLDASTEGWALRLDAWMDRLTPAQLLGYWPESVADKPREWVTENLQAADLSDLDLALRLKPDTPPALHADFRFENARIRFAKTLPPLEDARGRASLLGRRFSATTHAGVVRPGTGGEIDASGSSFIIPDIGIPKAAPGIARLRAAGGVTEMMAMLDRPPLEVLSKAGLPVDLAEGKVTMQGTLALPLKDRVLVEELDFHFTGGVSDLSSSVLVPGTVLSAEYLSLRGDNTVVELSGQGLFGAVPVQARWRQPIGAPPETRSRLTGTIAVSRALLEEIDAALPPDMLSGEGQAAFEIDLGGGQAPTLTANSNLAGVILAIPQLGWRKPAGTEGRFEIAARLGPDPVVERLSLDAAGLRARGTIAFRSGGGFDRLRLSSFELGDWLAVPAEIVGRGSAAPDIRVLGGVLDLRRSQFGSGGGTGGGDAPGLSIALDRLQITSDIALTGLRGRLTTARGLSGTFTAKLNGGPDLTGQVLPRPQGAGVMVQATDAGSVFRAAGILQQAVGGSFQMVIDPLEAEGYYDAQLAVRDTRIRDAPAMAALLNAISVVGLIDEMSGQGILFSEIDARMQITPQALRVLSASAEGPSIGLSMDGVVDTQRQLLNLRGVVSPVYLLNSIGSVLTRKGEGVIGFNYTLSGSTTSPQVSINPLSGLAPGFLREIFREPAPSAPAPQTPAIRGQQAPAQPSPAAPAPSGGGGDR
ncbi:AsmA-like C-terminal region-containing protein [Lutimaribacter marinistellae]|uniref:AsmA-like C-terminal region-containing protein n=1 Tax=Lutimaribacter marinistellae TaxID=1820329 RepID=A0ABV7TIQ7_9RHOB